MSNTINETTGADDALRIYREKSQDCNADLGHPCDSNDGEPCHECAENKAYWRREWERYGRHERTREEFEADVMDAYSDPSEQSKRDTLLRRLA